MEHKHECVGGCGTPMQYPGERCKDCREWLKSHREEWDNAAENVKGIGLTIAREIRREDSYKMRNPIRETGGKGWTTQRPGNSCADCADPRIRGTLYCERHQRA
ncbi:MAG: hypothetical protein BMS9Abin17_1334 [Acidimicrobiia bacterium]|nr:MAG: hypothetical protein BMS9Abin17_1334 [Acidimicrobiia bacterium]